MLFDKMSLFADGLAVPTTASTDTYSKVLDLRRNGELGIDGELKIYGQVVGTPNSTGSVTTVVQTSADGASWTDLASQTQDGNLLIGMFFFGCGYIMFMQVTSVWMKQLFPEESRGSVFSWKLRRKSPDR